MNKIWKHIKSGYKWLNGKKRRVGLAMALIANQVSDPTVSMVLNVGALLLGGADGAEAILNKVKKKKELPGGMNG